VKIKTADKDDNLLKQKETIQNKRRKEKRTYTKKKINDILSNGKLTGGIFDTQNNSFTFIILQLLTQQFSNRKKSLVKGIGKELFPSIFAYKRCFQHADSLAP